MSYTIIISGITGGTAIDTVDLYECIDDSCNNCTLIPSYSSVDILTLNTPGITISSINDSSTHIKVVPNGICSGNTLCLEIQNKPTPTPTPTPTETPTPTPTPTPTETPTPTPTETPTPTPTPTLCDCFDYDFYLDGTHKPYSTGNTDPSFDNKFYIDYYECPENGGSLTTLEFNYPSEGGPGFDIYTSLFCSNDNIVVGYPKMYYYENDVAVEAYPNGTYLTNTGNCCSITPTPTPTPTETPTPTPTPTYCGDCDEYFNNNSETYDGINYTDCSGIEYTNVSVGPNEGICVIPGTISGNFGFLTIIGTCGQYECTPTPTPNETPTPTPTPTLPPSFCSDITVSQLDIDDATGNTDPLKNGAVFFNAVDYNGNPIEITGYTAGNIVTNCLISIEFSGTYYKNDSQNIGSSSATLSLNPCTDNNDCSLS